MHNDLFKELGLSTTEASINETLINEGESPVGVISQQANIHRRNGYDQVNRFIKKGLVI